MRATAATFKLGISFENWGLKGDRYIHSFGRNGKPTWMCEFHNFWLRSLELGVQSELGDYCFELQAAKAGKFAHLAARRRSITPTTSMPASTRNSCGASPKASASSASKARSRK